MLQSNADFRMQAQVPAAVPIEDKFGRLLSQIIFLKSIILIFVHIADNVTVWRKAVWLHICFHLFVLVFFFFARLVCPFCVALVGGLRCGLLVCFFALL